MGPIRARPGYNIRSMPDLTSALSRRRLLLAAAALPAASLLASCQSTRRPTDADGPAPTLEQTEGPFYRLMSPARTSLREPDLTGTPLLLTGRVLDRRGKPLANALLDFWQCDEKGIYDTRAFRLRGHQFTDGDGRYQLDTIVPGLYPGRTRHIHVKLQPQGSDVPDSPSMLNLTTQVYFPGEERNATDDIFDPSLLVAIDRDGDRQLGRYDFVLDLG